MSHTFHCPLFVASDVGALVAHTHNVIYLEDGEVVEVYKDKIIAKDIADKDIQKEIKEVTLRLEEINKGGYNPPDLTNDLIIFFFA